MSVDSKEEHPGDDDTEVPEEHRTTCRNVITMITHASDASQLHVDTWVTPAQACSECCLPLDGYLHKQCHD
jgi:hypothetical protein